MKPITIKVCIQRIGINGEGIGFSNGKPVFIDGAMVGETVIGKVVETNPRYLKVKLMKVVEPSKHRVIPTCRLARYCDGCALAHCDQVAQTTYKQMILEEALNKYGPTMKYPINPLIPSIKQYGYRNSCKLFFGDDHGKIAVGLYKKNSHDFVIINDQCIIHDALINQTIRSLLLWLNQHHIKVYDRKTKSGLRGVCIRVLDGKTSMILVGTHDVFSSMDFQSLIGATKVDVLGTIINTKREIHSLSDGNIMYHTQKHALDLSMDDMVFTIRPQAFFQLNLDQLNTMVQTIKQYLPNNRRVFEGYCGIGILGLLLHGKINSLDGVEIVESAIVDAKANAKANRINGFNYHCGDSAQWFRKQHMVKPYDVVLVDPPRSGLDDAMVQTILYSKVKTIIYVSCNPVTLAKNLKVLSKKYRIDMVQPLDMFPNTPHVETIVLLSKMNEHK